MIGATDWAAFEFGKLLYSKDLHCYLKAYKSDSKFVYAKVVAKEKDAPTNLKLRSIVKISYKDIGKKFFVKNFNDDIK